VYLCAVFEPTSCKERRFVEANASTYMPTSTIYTFRYIERPWLRNLPVVFQYP